MQTTALKTNQNHLLPLYKNNQKQPFSVGQLAKTLFPTEKPSKNRTLSVGRHAKKTSHTHTRTRDLLFDQNAMSYLSHLLDALQKEHRIVLHNPDYIKAIYAQYDEQDANFFLQWIKTFAMIRSHDRTRVLENVIVTAEEDFLSALQIMRQRKIDRFNLNIDLKNKVWQHLQKNFQDLQFNTQLLVKELKLDPNKIEAVLLVLQLEKKVVFWHVFKGWNIYRLSENKLNNGRFTTNPT